MRSTQIGEPPTEPTGKHSWPPRPSGTQPKSSIKQRIVSKAQRYIECSLLVRSVSQVSDCAGRETLQDPMDDGQSSLADVSLLLCTSPIARLASFPLRYGKYVVSTSHSKQPEIGRRVPNWRTLVGPASTCGSSFGRIPRGEQHEQFPYHRHRARPDRSHR
jgi:hypothetical protein